MSAAAALAQDANDVRILPTFAAPRRHVLVHLTSFAPGCDKYGIDDARRWRQFWSAEPLPVLRSVLVRLNRNPASVDLELQPNGDVAILGDADASIPDAEDDAAPVLRAPLAFVCDGASLDELAAALAALRALITPLHAQSGAVEP